MRVVLGEKFQDLYCTSPQLKLYIYIYIDIIISVEVVDSLVKTLGTFQSSGNDHCVRRKLVD